MRCFVPVTATATEEIFRISIGWVPGCCPATRVNLANTGKRRIFFYLLSSIIPFGSDEFGWRRRRCERWQAGWWWNMGHVVRLGTTSLDAESTPRRPYNGALTGRPTGKRVAITYSLYRHSEITTSMFTARSRSAFSATSPLYLTMKTQIIHFHINFNALLQAKNHFHTASIRISRP